MAQELERENNSANSEVNFNIIIKQCKSLPLVDRNAAPLKYNFPEHIAKTARTHLCMAAIIGT